MIFQPLYSPRTGCAAYLCLSAAIPPKTTHIEAILRFNQGSAS